MSCLNCTDPECEYRGTDRAACEDHDAEPHREIVDPVSNLLAGLRSDLNDCMARIATLQRQWDDFWAAMVRAREGEE
jgi:hypothetical protein